MPCGKRATSPQGAKQLYFIAPELSFVGSSVIIFSNMQIPYLNDGDIKIVQSNAVSMSCIIMMITGPWHYQQTAVYLYL